MGQKQPDSLSLLNSNRPYGSADNQTVYVALPQLTPDILIEFLTNSTARESDEDPRTDALHFCFKKDYHQLSHRFT